MILKMKKHYRTEGLGMELENGVLDTLIYRLYTGEGRSEGLNVMVTYSGRMEMRG